MMKKLSRAKISELLEIPYPTLCDWGKREADNWRYKLHKFLENLSEEEIEAINNRDKENIVDTKSIKKDIEILSSLKGDNKEEFIKSCSKEQIANLSAAYIIGRRGWDNSTAANGTILSNKEKAAIIKNDFLDEKKDLDDESELFSRKEWLSKKSDLSEKLTKGLRMIEEIKS